MFRIISEEIVAINRAIFNAPTELKNIDFAKKKLTLSSCVANLLKAISQTIK